MVVQTIQISFSSYAADTIRIHTGETGREILFVPDMEISGTYSADFIVIKPDDTFVIAAATITDGKINVEIPEQAGAVAGAGHYILKIYDSGEVCIYSASGGFMVDDHLLTDGIIESVAEVYGYNFPQDFALKSEIPDIDDIIDDETTGIDSTWSSKKITEEIAAASPDPSAFIDDNAVLYDKTWSSEKISYELGNIPAYDVYTTTEQPVGRWIDGRTVYQKTYVANLQMGAWIAIQFDVQNFDFAINISHMETYDDYMLGSGYWENSNYHSSIQMRRIGGVWYIRYYAPSIAGNKNVIITVRYVKTA